jgi:hypothetical protein
MMIEPRNPFEDAPDPHPASEALYELLESAGVDVATIDAATKLVDEALEGMLREYCVSESPPASAASEYPECVVNCVEWYSYLTDGKPGDAMRPTDEELKEALFLVSQPVRVGGTFVRKWLQHRSCSGNGCGLCRGGMIEVGEAALVSQQPAAPVVGDAELHEKVVILTALIRAAIGTPESVSDAEFAEVYDEMAASFKADGLMPTKPRPG